MPEWILQSHDSVVVASRYLDVKRRVMTSGHLDEVIWQASISFDDLTESCFIAEAAWVVLCSGFRERVVDQMFPSISRSFHMWESATRIADTSDKCVREALEYFGHRRKLEAIVEVCSEIADVGFDSVKAAVGSGGADYLERFPFLGPVTSRHLAKNLGLDQCKPDRHLVRLAERGQFSSVDELCNRVSEVTGDEVGVVDVVLWRACEMQLIGMATA